MVSHSLVEDLNPKCKLEPKRYLDLKNPTPWDDRIVFVKEPHKYFWDGNCEDVLSVTGLYKPFFPDFDGPATARGNIER